MMKEVALITGEKEEFERQLKEYNKCGWSGHDFSTCAVLTKTCGPRIVYSALMQKEGE